MSNTHCGLYTASSLQESVTYYFPDVLFLKHAMEDKPLEEMPQAFLRDFRVPYHKAQIALPAWSIQDWHSFLEKLN